MKAAKIKKLFFVSLSVSLALWAIVFGTYELFLNLPLPVYYLLDILLVISVMSIIAAIVFLVFYFKYIDEED